MPRWVKLLLAPLWLPLGWWSAAGLAVFLAAAPAPGAREGCFVGGLGLYALIVILSREKGRSFAHTFEHELTHLVAGVLCFQKPSKLIVGREAGETHLSGGNWFISLAPYFLPLWGLIPLLLLPLMNRTGTLAALGALGFLYGLHLYSTVNEFSLKQPDLTEHGRIFSTCAILSLNLLILAVVLAAVTGGWSAIGEWFRLAGQTARADFMRFAAGID